MKLLFLFKISLFGTWLVDTLSPTSPMGSAIRAFDLQTGYQLCQGGQLESGPWLDGNVPREWGTYVQQNGVDRIVIEGGRATGVQLADGRTVRARDFVASAIDVHQTFEGLIDRSQLPAALVEKLDRFEGTPWTIFGVHLALDQPPMFDAASHDANINRALKWSVGAETLEDLFSGFGDVSQGRIPASIQFGAGPISGIDPSQAPPGKHTAYAWHVMPYDAEENAVDRARFREDFADEMMRTWTRYCPNMTSRNVLDRHVYTAHDYTREFVNMRDGDIFMGAFNAAQTMDNHFGYRPPVPGLYMAGSACHPGGAISGGAGYICAGLIAADLGITPWWAPVNARDAHERFAAD